jgi:uncharacterized coiled-coil protein SlyX
MATTLALAMRASMSASGVVSGSKQASDALDRMGRQAAQTARDVGTLKNIAIGAILVKSAHAAAAAIRSVTNAAKGLAGELRNNIDESAKLAARLGMSVESLQALQMTAKMAGVKELTPILQKMATVLGQASSGAKPAIEAFQQIGLSIDDLERMSPEQQFKAIAAAINALPTPAAKAAAAVKVFGEQGISLLPMLSQNLAEVEERMKRLGAVVSADQSSAIEEMNDALAMTQAMFEGIAGQVLGNLAPVVTALAEEIMAMVESFNGVSGSGGEGIANAISETMFDIIEYLASVFDWAAQGFGEFGATMSGVADVFTFVGNAFAVAVQAFVAGWNVAEMALDYFLLQFAKLLEGVGGLISSDLESFAKEWQYTLNEQGKQNAQEFIDAAQKIEAIISGESADQPIGAAQQGVRDLRKSVMSPEAKAEREAARKRKEEEARAAREAAAAAAKAAREAAAAEKARQDAEKKAAERAKKAAAVQEKIDAKQGDIDEMRGERAAALSGKSNEALQANDIRSGEGMSQFLALASGREDPAIAEYRKQTQKLEEMKAELRALQQEKVEILGGANN